MRIHQARKGFWREAVAIQRSATLQVLPSVLSFGLIAAAFCGVALLVDRAFQVRFALEIASFGFVGVALGLLIVIRLNAGYDRWWEARKLWGGVVNQSRNLVIGATAYGPDDATWQRKLVTWAAVLPHVTRHSLRGESPSAAVAGLVGPEEAALLAASDHMPSYAALRIAGLLREARDRSELDGFTFLQIDRERSLLIDHVGACERILSTPLPRMYSINIRLFILLFLLVLPLALLNSYQPGWFVPAVTMLVAYLLLSLDQIGVELENPFSTGNLSRLPLDRITSDIERNLLGLSGTTKGPAAVTPDERDTHDRPMPSAARAEASR